MQKPDIQELSDFLIKYTKTLLSAGTYTARVAKCVGRIAEVYDYEININFFFHHITLNIVDKQNSSIQRTYIVSNNHAYVNFRLIFDLSALSWAIYDHKYEFDKAKIVFEQICEQKRHSYLLNLLFVSMANSAFCRLFGGDFGAGVLVFFATFIGLILRFVLTKFNIDLRMQYILCSFISSWFVFFGLDMEYTNTSDIALGSSILYLIPGVFFINSVIDILKDNILMGLSRIINVAILVCCIALGIYITLSISNFGILQ
ncbi:threonine/serine exporter ThrE family protein [Campylobacter hepaticus]|uniref:Threonine/serine exporter ThrE family protein n=1 Tax=Campylobacter hepaticus TaxID=1813019 RepID=A0A424YZT1_9BACT|nr:threonine/serine exporter ThrE family protein [Campylobacter hepaticus]RQD69350.1 threonine/serine exporter ThrE family protein [Campylobacter hepaticus]RQD86717.1 threonine/serine exporter ThrE family protein [Campylobacter hepaticus]